MPNQKDPIYTSAVPDMDAIIHDLHVLHDATTKGDWQKGATTHETVAIGEKGKSYHVASFRHAADAAFVDVAHRFIKPVLDELARLREIVGDKGPEGTARVKAEVLIDDEAIEKRFVAGLPKSDTSTLTVEKYLRQQKHHVLQNNSYPALFPAALTEEIALEIIEGESNMGFSQSGEAGKNWTFSVCSEPTLIGLEAVLYLSLLKGWGGGIPVDAAIRRLTMRAEVPYMYTVAEAKAIIANAEKNGFEFNGVSTSKGGRCRCSEIETVPLLQAVLTLIHDALVKEGTKPSRIVDEINLYINPGKEITGE